MMKGMVFAERYQLADFIGQGGMSLVYRAVDVRTGHSVAVKILKREYNSDKEFLERFQREAQAASLMSHHNIVNLLDVGVEGEYRYLVLEYVSGNTLKDIIRKKGQLSTNTAIQIAIRILSALQHAHDSGIIHRDIKPQNVLVHSDGHVKVADFGIARMTNSFTISKGDTVVGSVHYSSPEQATGAVVDATSDIYSTGVVLYEMLTGRVPFTGDTPVAVAMQHIKVQPLPVKEYNPDVPPAVEAVVMRALEKSPHKRYRSAREMADALARARDGKEEVQKFADSAGTSKPLREDTSRRDGRRQGDIQRSRRAGSRSGRNVRRRKMLSGFFTFLMVAGVLTLLIMGVVQIYNQVISSTVAPELEGMMAEDAQAAVRRAGLKWQQSNVNHDTMPQGMVISQIPEADTSMMKGDSMVVTVSQGPITSLAPDLIGLSQEDAARKLKDKGLSMVIFRIASSEPVGTVLSQNPAKDMPAALGTEVEITISGGSTMVPDAEGLTYENAAVLLQENNLVVGRLEYVEVDDAQMVGHVKSQSPTAGTLTVLGAQVTLTLAKEGKAYHSEISFILPESKEQRMLRVVLVEDGNEVEQYKTVLLPAETSQTLLVPISSNQTIPLICRVYIDEILLEEQEVQLR